VTAKSSVARPSPRNNRHLPVNIGSGFFTGEENRYRMLFQIHEEHTRKKKLLTSSLFFFFFFFFFSWCVHVTPKKGR